MTLLWVLRRLVLAAVLALSAMRGAGAEEVRAFTVEQARLVGLAAIEARRPDLAVDIATQVLQRDPDDAFARFLLARAFLDMGQMHDAGAQARLAFRLADSPEQRHQSARLAAQAAWNEGRIGVAQRWLRRAAIAAPAPASRAERVRELAAVRAANPLDVSLSFAVNPSDNVNDGSSSAYNIIDGVPVVGVLSADGQALSGVVGQLQAGLRYRLPGAGNLHVGALLNLRRVELSDKAKARVPDLDPRSFDSARAELSLGKTWSPEGASWRAEGEATAGLQMDGGDLSYRYLRLDGSWMRGFGDSTGVDVGLGVERRETQPGFAQPIWASSLSFGLRRALPGDDVVTGRLYASRTDTPQDGRSSQTYGVDVTYVRGRPIGPALLSLQAGYSVTAFPGYRVGFIVVPGGRQDRTVTAGMTLTFPGISVQGFSPRLSITHTDTQSNVSRFETQKTGITLGLTASF